MKTLLLTLTLLFSSIAGAQSITPSKAECEKLLDAVLPLAEQMLQKHGEFFPYSGALKENGEIASIAGYDGREQPPSKDIIFLLKQAFVKGAKSKEYKATALVYDVKVTLPSSGKKSDAFAVSLNHRDSYSVIVLFPYELKNKKLSFGETFAQKGEADVFPSK
ncbi:MAG: hypothetical protein WCB36_09860 [Burkholderiales bacterium]